MVLDKKRFVVNEQKQRQPHVAKDDGFERSYGTTGRP
jgi:hypothetical protein